MKISVFLAVAAGIATTALSAFPSEAANVRTTTIGGNINDLAAYRIEGLEFGGSFYDIDFDHGSFTEGHLEKLPKGLKT